MKRVGIIGVGTMGTTHAQAWSGTNAELVGFFDIDTEAARQVAEATAAAGGERATAFPTREALFEAVDIVDVCVPTFAHKDVAVAAATAGRHVVCEKPMALSLDDCAAMIRAAENNNVRLFIAQVVRFFPEYAAAKRLVDDGVIGKLGVVRLRRGGSSPAEGPKKWFTHEYLSGGAVLDLMVHDIDYARWLGGDVERVYCKRFLGGGADYALVTLRYRGGAMAHVEGCWAYPTGMWRTGFDIAGDDGLLCYDNEAAVPLRLRLRDEQAAGGGVTVPSSPMDPSDNPYHLELKHFVDCLLSGEEFLVTPRDAMAAVQIALAARQSALSGQPVTLEPLSI